MSKETIAVAPQRLEIGDVIKGMRRNSTEIFYYDVEREVKPVLVDGLTACKAYREGKTVRMGNAEWNPKSMGYGFAPNFLYDGWEVLS